MPCCVARYVQPALGLRFVEHVLHFQGIRTMCAKAKAPAADAPIEVRHTPCTPLPEFIIPRKSARTQLKLSRSPLLLNLPLCSARLSSRLRSMLACDPNFFANKLIRVWWEWCDGAIRCSVLNHQRRFSVCALFPVPEGLSNSLGRMSHSGCTPRSRICLVYDGVSTCGKSKRVRAHFSQVRVSSSPVSCRSADQSVLNSFETRNTTAVNRRENSSCMLHRSDPSNGPDPSNGAVKRTEESKPENSESLCMTQITTLDTAATSTVCDSLSACLAP